MTSRMRRPVEVIQEYFWPSRWLLVIALVFAPWCWGSTWPRGIETLNLLLLAATIAWLGESILRRVGIDLPRVLLIGTTLLLVQGWFMALHAQSIHAEATGLLAPLEPPIPWLPGSIERDCSTQTMARLTSLIGTLLLAAKAGESSRWRKRLLATMTATAVSIVFLGCWQRWTHANDIFWSTTRHLDFFFATYRNVTNAGEYINLVLPIAASLALVAGVKSQHAFIRAGTISATVILIAGAVVNGSKIAPLLAVGLGICFILLQLTFLRRLWGRVNGKAMALTLLVTIGSLGIVTQSMGLL